MDTSAERTALPVTPKKQHRSVAEKRRIVEETLTVRLASWFGPLRRFILAHPWNVRVERVLFRSAVA